MRKLIAIVPLFLNIAALTQENYEIQVYSSPTMTKGNTIFELHSNYTFQGEKQIVEGVRPAYHALHETLEITHGITENFELGFYLFTNFANQYGYKVVGTHLRPRVSAPTKWNWPVGASISLEFGYQRKEYSSETWNIEIRPIIDKQFNNFYLSFNPTFGISIKGTSTDHTPAFEPNVKASYTIHKVAVGLEYYGDLGQLDNVPEFDQQAHALFIVADVYADPRWELNVGPGFGLTEATDGFIFKLLIGRRINWNHKK